MEQPNHHREYLTETLGWFESNILIEMLIPNTLKPYNVIQISTLICVRITLNHKFWIVIYFNHKYYQLQYRLEIDAQRFLYTRSTIPLMPSCWDSEIYRLHVTVMWCVTISMGRNANAQPNCVLGTPSGGDPQCRNCDKLRGNWSLHINRLARDAKQGRHRNSCGEQKWNHIRNKRGQRSTQQINDRTVGVWDDSTRTFGVNWWNRLIRFKMNCLFDPRFPYLLCYSELQK